MQLFSSVLCLALAALSVAQIVVDSVSTTTQCRTIPGQLSICPTRTTSHTETYTSLRATVILHPTFTSTSSVVDVVTSLNVTNTTVTISPSTTIITDTIIDSVTSTLNGTNTVVINSTATQTSTVYTTTGVFLPVQDTLANSSEVNDTAPPQLKRFAPARMNPFERRQASALTVADLTAPTAQPCKSVICAALTTSFVNTTVTKTAVNRIVTTIVTQVTNSTTVVPVIVPTTIAPSESVVTVNVTSTITILTTFTPTTTQTINSTLVQTIQAAATAFCNATNFANTVNSSGINAIGLHNPAASTNLVSWSNNTDAAGCCEACSADPNCSVWFFKGNGTDSDGCRFYESRTTCNNGDYTFSVELAGSAGSGFTVGNGGCGDYDALVAGPPLSTSSTASPTSSPSRAVALI